MRGALGYGFPRRRIKPLTKRRSPKLIGTAITEASHGLIEFFTRITRTNNHTEPYRFHDRIAPRYHSQCNSSVLRCHALNRSLRLRLHLSVLSKDTTARLPLISNPTQ